MIPEWPAGTATVLTTAGDAPHAVPVSTAVRTGDATVAFALGRRRTSLARLRADGRCALTVLAGEDLAVTLHGTATVVAEDLEGTVALRLDVERVQDHMSVGFSIAAGVDWHWTNADAAARDAAVRGALTALVAGSDPG